MGLQQSKMLPTKTADDLINKLPRSTLRETLVKTLEMLGRGQFNEFKERLSGWDVSPGYERIPMGSLQGADVGKVADLIIDYYKNSYGVKVTLGVLGAIGAKSAANHLEKIKPLFCPAPPSAIALPHPPSAISLPPISHCFAPPPHFLGSLGATGL
uniref:Pyrin domain-containing protein n=1 Tax=Xenopus tropicalis TaxID=8364 RepID=A0A1B8Y1J9_XENTR